MKVNGFAAFANTLLTDTGSQFYKPGRQYGYRAGRMVAARTVIGREIYRTAEDILSYYKSKIRHGGETGLSGPWEALSEVTVEKRARLGAGTPDDPLYYTKQIYDSLAVEIKEDYAGPDSVAALVGVEAGQHVNPWGTQSVAMNRLINWMEDGTSKMPPRPIFTGDDWEELERQAVSKFEEKVIRSGILGKLLS